MRLRCSARWWQELCPGRITEPVKALVAGMREVLAGNLHYRVRIEREDEVGFLARAFNEMVGGLEERERINDTFGRFVSRDVARPCSAVACR